VTPGARTPVQGDQPVAARRRPADLPPGVRTTLLAVAGVRSGSVVLDLTPGAALFRPAGAAAGKSGLALVAAPAALAETIPAVLRGAVVTHAFASLPGSRLLTVLRPLLRPGARVAVTGADEDAVQEAATVAAYDLVYLERDVDGLVVAALRPRPPS
jgi:hypothetical protein